MKEQSKITPNTFQTPNVLADEYMRFLTGDETKCYLVVTRKTLGWLKRTDKIATSVIGDMTGLADSTVTACMKSLRDFGLVVKVSENNPHENYGIEWALEMDSVKINTPAMQARKEKRVEKDQAWGSKMKAKKAEKAGIYQVPTPLTNGDGGSLSNGPQKPLSIAPIIKKEEEKPVSKIENTTAEIAEVFKFFAENFQLLTTFNSQLIDELCNTYSAAWVLEAMKDCATRNKRNLKYAEAILSGWKSDGFQIDNRAKRKQKQSVAAEPAVRNGGFYA